MILLDKQYYGEDIHEAGDDVLESIGDDVPRDSLGFHHGTFRVVVEWIPDDEDDEA